MTELGSSTVNEDALVLNSVAKASSSSGVGEESAKGDREAPGPRA